MGWGPAPVTSLVIPSDASDTDARIVIGGTDVLPADLIAFYAAKNIAIVYGRVTWSAGSPLNASYTYEITGVPTIGVPRPIDAFGSRDGFSITVQETAVILGGAWPTSTLFGSNRFENVGDVAFGLSYSAGGSTPDFTIQGVSQPRGILWFDGGTGTTSVAAPNDNLIAEDGFGTTYAEDRAFLVVLDGFFLGNVAGIFAELRLKTGVGTVISGPSRTVALQLAASAMRMRYFFEFINTSGGPFNTQCFISMKPSANTATFGGAGAAATGWYAYCLDNGAAADHPTLQSL